MTLPEVVIRAKREMIEEKKQEKDVSTRTEHEAGPAFARAHVARVEGTSYGSKTLNER